MNRDKLSVIPQYLAPQRGLTTLAGWLANTRRVWLKNLLIRYFIRRYNVDLNATTISDLAYYPTFNSFFTRYIKSELRPIAPHFNAITSPADGTISQIGNIDDQEIFQAKGFYFTLTELLGGTPEEINNFRHGQFTTIYLSPRDYHRVHMPITGKLRKTIFIPGKLFSVNQKTSRAVPRLFARNERLVCFFDTEIGPIAIILVGAMLVGSIGTIWQDPIKGNKITETHYTENDSIEIARGDELGHFKMGSTVILITPKDKVVWRSDLEANSLIMMGEEIGKFHFHS